MSYEICHLELQNPVKFRWQEQFQERSTLLTKGAIALVGTQRCRHCGGLWFYSGLTTGVELPDGSDKAVYWYLPTTTEALAHCDAVAHELGDAADPTASATRERIEDLLTTLRIGRGERRWLRLVDHGEGALYSARGAWERWPE